MRTEQEVEAARALLADLADSRDKIAFATEDNMFDADSGLYSAMEQVLAWVLGDGSEDAELAGTPDENPLAEIIRLHKKYQ